MKKKFSIKNGRGLLIRGEIEWTGKNFGTPVILCHGFKAFMDQPQIIMPAKALTKAGYTAVRFDATNSIGRSDGSMEQFTVSGYNKDIRKVTSFILKALKQDKYYLFGYSIAGLASYQIAAQDSRIKGLILQEPTYNNLKQIMSSAPWFPFLKEHGWAISWSNTLQRNIKIGYKVYKQGVKHKIESFVRKIKCPVLIFYGTKEELVVKKIFLDLYKQLQSPKKIIAIPGAPHTLRKARHINYLSRHLINWLRAYENKA